MKLIIQGKEQAFDQLYERYGQRMHAYFYRMLYQSNEKAADFTQELFLKIIERPQAFDPSRKFSTWFYAIAYNMCKNEYRRIGRKPLTAELNEAQYKSIETDIPQRIDQALFDEYLQEAVDKLTPVCRECFVLRFQEELSIKQISVILDCPEGTVKSRIHYTLKKLASELNIFDPRNKHKDYGFKAG